MSDFHIMSSKLIKIWKKLQNYKYLVSFADVQKAPSYWFYFVSETSLLAFKQFQIELNGPQASSFSIPIKGSYFFQWRKEKLMIMIRMRKLIFFCLSRLV